MIAQLLIKVCKSVSSHLWNGLVQDGIKVKDGKLECTGTRKTSIKCLTPYFGIDYESRLPCDIAKKYGRKVIRLSNCLASKQVRFNTDATAIQIECVYQDKYSSSNMSERATSGIDIYEVKDGKYTWKKTVAPRYEINMHIKEVVELSKGEKEVVLYLPSYASLHKLNIKPMCENCVIKSVKKNKKNILVYGSSVTQGCASSRPGLSYTNVLSRLTEMSIINCGFSESALAQADIIEYIANLHADTYVIEYDHNADVDLFRNTHYEVYSKIRAQNRTALIIFMSRFSGGISISRSEELERIDIIKSTLNKAHENDDNEIYFLCGDDALIDKDYCFTDDRHPNDYGMMQIAKKLSEIILQEIR